MPQMESESGNASPEMSRTIDLEDKMWKNRNTSNEES
jgi:hypothetical protein